MASYDDGYATGQAHLREQHKDDCDYEDGDGCPRYVALPHQCDAWRIGTPEQARKLITDLYGLIVQLEGRDDA